MHCFEGLTSESVHVLHVTCPQGLATERRRGQKHKDNGDCWNINLRNIKLVFENAFLQHGHMGASSFFFEDSPLSVAGVESTEDVALAETVSKAKFTDISCFRLDTAIQ